RTCSIDLTLCATCGDAVPNRWYCSDCGANLAHPPQRCPEKGGPSARALPVKRSGEVHLPPPALAGLRSRAPAEEAPPTGSTPECEFVAYLTLSQAAKLIPGRRPGKAASLKTVWRYCTRGIRNGIRLQSKMVGGHRCTTRGWVEEFIDALTTAGD